jgi:hypothetical protein
MDTFKLQVVVGSVSTPLENLLQPVSRAIRHVAQNLDFRGSAGILTPLWNGGPLICFEKG